MSSSQHGSVIKPQLVSKARRLLAPVGGVALVLAAAVAGASVANRDGSSSLPATNQRREIASARPKVSVVDSSNSSEKTITAAQSRVLVEARETVPLKPDRAQRDEPSLGRAASKSPHRADSRAPVRPHPASRGPSPAVAPGAASPPGRSSLEEPRSSTNGADEPSDFAHGRGTAHVARPIDTSSPYAN